LPGKKDGRPLRIEVRYPLIRYKRKESPGHYIIEGEGINIFVLGMVYLSPDQRASLGSEISPGAVDEDLVPSLFRQGGINALQNLRGEFNIVIVDVNAEEVTCLSSRFGLLPLYYAENSETLYLSDSLTALGEASGRHELDKAVLAQLCLYNYSLSNDSLIKGCSVLPAGSCLRFCRGQIKLRRYWVPDQLLDLELVRGEAAVDLIDGAFAEAIRTYSSQVDTTALSLTGGWDGRLVLGYILEDMAPDKIQLYSFGTEESQDVAIPRLIAGKMALNYHPYILDQKYLDTSYLAAARETALRSDGYRSVQRAHYLYATRDLAKEHAYLISGICGSNVMKAAATTPSVVMNARILRILASAEPEKEISQHLDELKQTLSREFDQVGRDEWLGSVFSEELKRSLEQKTYPHRVSCFVFGILERKYFGPELASYRHLIGNYSPFIDPGFIDSLARTEYFNAFRASEGIFGNMSNAVLYAKLISRHSERLAGFPSDKYVKLSDLLRPAAYPAVAAKQIYRRLIRRHMKTNNPYNTDDTLPRFIAANPGFYGLDAATVRDKNMLGSYVTAMYWHGSSFSRAQGSGEPI